MKNYYEIMGLSTAATDHEIKYVFRRLAIAYHPDKNPSPEAEAMFKEVNEAYEVLSDPQKKIVYDQLLSGLIVVTQETQQSWHKDPAYRKRRQSGYKPPPRGPSPRMIMMESFLKYSTILSWVAWVWSALLIIDYALPSVILTEKITTDISVIKKIAFKSTSDLLFTDHGHHFPVSFHELKYFPHGSDIKIFRSHLFSLLIKAENENSTYQINNLASIYRNFVFAPVLLTILSLTALFGGKGIEFRFNLGVVTFLIFLLNIGFFFMSKI